MQRKWYWHLWWTGWVCREVMAAVFQRRLFGLASEMAYNAMLALFPSILAVLTAFGTFRAEETEGMFRFLAGQLGAMAPEEARSLVQNFVSQIQLPNDRGLFSASFIIALWIASSAIGAAMNAMDEIHQIPYNQRRPFWVAKPLSLVLTIGIIGLIITASFLIFVSDFVLRQSLANLSPSFHPIVEPILGLWHWLSWPAALAILSVAFGVLYRYGPSRWNNNNVLVPGGIVGAILWASISWLFKLYVLNFGNYNRIYGTIGAVIILLWWLNLGSISILIGAQFNVTLRQIQSQFRANRTRN
ncbi:MAG TPA: YihY/virulence factor BrkB family protein [Coleofasciculaceae cyanobacterium]